jgi:tRNA 2-selenouridine synthase
MVEQLLREHYDPAYLRSIARNFRASGQARELLITSDDAAAFAAAAGDLVS